MIVLLELLLRLLLGLLLGDILDIWVIGDSAVACTWLRHIGWLGYVMRVEQESCSCVCGIDL